jgi:selenocysteine lyase/cysteine desulfurase
MTKLDRRGFLGTGIGFAALAGCEQAGHGTAAPAPSSDANELFWQGVRSQFALEPGIVHMSAILFASNPRIVREAIERHRKGLDANPVRYIYSNNVRLQEEAREAAANHLGIERSAVALTDSTTMGLGLIYNGLQLRPGDEILSTEHDHYATRESLRLAAGRTGATVRTIPLYESSATAKDDDIVERIAKALSPATRAIALTWVHSSTGVKLPIARIAARIKEANARRDADDRILLCVDGVHGLGNQDVTFADLGCDFFIAGCHKWLFGPRGTGIIAGTGAAWEAVVPTIPSFIGRAWPGNGEAGGSAAAMSPGGFKPFEHQWALAETFRFNAEIGKTRIARRTAELATQLKHGLASMTRVRLHTPRAEALSAGIVAFEVDGLSAHAVVERLAERRVVATVAPYTVPYARLTPSIYNTPAEIDIALREVRGLTA